MELYNSLDLIAKINFKSYTHNDVQGRLDKLSKASDNYQTKIGKSYFAGKKGDGKERIQTSKDLKQFANEQKKLINEAGKGVICPNETFEDMSKRNVILAKRIDDKYGKMNFNEELERARKEMQTVAGKNGVAQMDKEECLSPMARIATITVIRHQEKLTGKSVDYTKEEFNEQVKLMKGDKAFTRAMSSLTPEKMYKRATSENDRALLIDDLNKARNEIDKEEKAKQDALLKKQLEKEKDKVLQIDPKMAVPQQ